MFDPMMAGALLALVSSAGILGAFALMYIVVRVVSK